MIQKKIPCFLLYTNLSVITSHASLLQDSIPPNILNILQNNFNNPATFAIESETSHDFFSIWQNPKYQGNKALKTIYDRMNFAFKEKPRLSNEYVYPTLKDREVPIELIGAQSNVSLLFAALTKNEEEHQEIRALSNALRCSQNVESVRSAALRNRELLSSYFLIRSFNNTKYINEQWKFWNPNNKSVLDRLLEKCPLIPQNLDPNGPILSFQFFDNLILFALFQYTNPLLEGFITENSTSEAGTLNTITTIWPTQMLPIPKLLYYKENVDSMSLYRIYFEEQSLHTADLTDGRQSYDGIQYLPEMCAFKGYQFTQLHARAEYALGSEITALSGYILNKNGTLLQQEGVALFAKKDGFQAYNYGLNSSIGQHAFTTDLPFYKDSEIYNSPYVEMLIYLAGGIERVKRDQLVFIPHSIPTMNESSIHQDAAFLLPYLYKLEEIDGNSEALTKTILLIENILTDQEYEDTKETLMTEIEQDIKVEIEQEINLGKSQDIEEIDERAKQHYAAYKRPAKKKHWGAESKKARDLSKQQLKNERIQTRLHTLSEEEKTRLKKEKALEKIRRHYLDKTRDRRHFNSLEVNDILANMRRSFAEIDVIETGEKVTRGSHTGIEIKTADSSIKLGLAKRPQDEGYKAGTVRTIINNHIDRILSLVLR